MILVDTNVVMGWKIATRDQEQFKKYFSEVTFMVP
jgi:hypothetical protein